MYCDVNTGLNRDRWHSVSIKVDPMAATLHVQVDDGTKSVVIEGLDKDGSYQRRQHINSTLFIGGIEKWKMTFIFNCDAIIIL